MQEQKKYFYKTLGLLPLTFILTVIFLVLLILKFKSPSENNYTRAYLDKIILLDKFNSKRIIFLGGSNLAFGMDSLRVEKEFPEYKVINTAVHAGIGLRYMLSDIKKHLKKDDIVIIAPEYSHFYTDGSGDYALWEVLSSKKKLENVDFTIFYKSLPSLLQGVKNIILSGKNLEFNKKFTYDKRGFNKNGDYVEHWKYDSKKQIAPSLISQNHIKISMIEFLEKFIFESKSKNIQVYLLPPVFQKTSFELNRSKINEISSKLVTKFEILPEDFSYEDYLFFDTPYHLNKQGVDKRTNQIIFYLKNKLEK